MADIYNEPHDVSHVEITVFQLREEAGGGTPFRHEHTRLESDENGSFYLWLPPGNYEVLFEKEGYQSVLIEADNFMGSFAHEIQLISK